MKKLLLVAFVGFISMPFLSCEKDTAIVDTGTIRYTNNSNGGNRYQIFLDGQSLGTLNAYKYYDKTNVPAGSHIVKSVQLEGYVLYPTVNEQTVNVTKGITLEFQFQ